MESEDHTVRNDVQMNSWWRLLLILAILLPPAILFLLPGGGLLTGGLWFWLALLMCVWLVWSLLGVPSDSAAAAQAGQAKRQILSPEQAPAVVRDVMEVTVASEQEGSKVFRGRLLLSPAAAYDKLKHTFSADTLPLVREDEQMGASISLIPRSRNIGVAEQPSRLWVHWILFGLTVVTTTWAGAAHQGIDLLREPSRFAVGLPYSLGLLAILGVHELGHYFTAKHHGMRVTAPYFIPVPFALGTFGAFIQMRSPSETRRMLFDVAVAGPLAGLAVAIPALLIGLKSSVVVAGGGASPMAPMAGTSVGSSFLFALLSKLALGDAVEYGHILRLSPLAFAGWLGLFVTALNLLPVGQLDGGHMAGAMFGRRAGDTISTVALWSLFLLAVFVWPALLMWALIVFFVAGKGAPPLNDLTPLTPRRRWVGYATFGILAAILIPFPHAFWSAAGIHCPYL